MMRNSSSSSRSYNYMEKVVVSSSGNEKNQKLKDRECTDGSGVTGGRVLSDVADELIVSTWPPRHYTCNFCKRRFKSAQALGGHMNVHRRARALLRSQSISQISSPSPWNPTNITNSHYHPQQNDESHFILTNPNLNWPLQNTPHLTRNPSYPYLHSLPIMSITSSSSASRQVNPHSTAASAYKHAPRGDQYLRPDHPFNGVSARKNNCIWVDQDKSKTNTHQADDPVLVRRLSLCNNSLTISNSTDLQDIDLELHL